MNPLFVDTGYLIALINPRDALHSKAADLAKKHRKARLVVTDLVIVETLNYFAERGTYFRGRSVASARALMDSPLSQVIITGRLHLIDGLEMYRNRKDQGLSLTDCVSVLTMRDMGLTEVLAYDNHFLAEGFMPLLRE